MAFRRHRRYDLRSLRRNAARVRRGFWPKFHRFAGQLPFAEDLLAAYYCAVDPRTPRAAKAVLMAALAYFVLPADTIPDVIAVLGFTDDAAVLMTAYRAISDHIGDDHRARARAFLAGSRAAGDGAVELG